MKHKRLNGDGPYRHTLKELGRHAYTMWHSPKGFTCLGCGATLTTGYIRDDIHGVRCRDCFVDYAVELEERVENAKAIRRA